MRPPVTIQLPSAANIYLQSYKVWLAQQAIAKNTQRAYHSRIKQYLLFREYANLNDKPLDDLASINASMALYLKFLKESKCKVRSINANINALNNFSQFLDLDYIDLKRERNYHKPLKILSAKEQIDFLSSIWRQKHARDRALAMVLYLTGLRIGDCAKLDIADVIIDDVVADADQTKSEGTSTYICVRRKSPDLVAKIILNEATNLALKQWLKERTKIKISGDQNALWLTQDGERLSISGITFVIKRIGWQANMSISTEILRRTALSLASEQFSKEELAFRFGGYISSTTIKRYGTFIPNG